MTCEVPMFFDGVMCDEEEGGLDEDDAGVWAEKGVMGWGGG